MFAAQTSKIKQHDDKDKKVCWILFLSVWRDVDVQPFTPLLFIVECCLICRLVHYQSIENKSLKGSKSVIVTLY